MSKYLVDDDFLYEHMENVENIILENLPSEEELSHKFSKRFERRMSKLIRQEKVTPFMKIFISYGKKAAAIFLIFTTIAFATTMSVEAYRVRFIEVITEVWEEFTSIIFKNNENVNDEKLSPVAPKYIPKDFLILEENTNNYMYSVIYAGKDNEEIYYEQRLLSDGEVLLDTENAKVETIEISSQEITLFTNKGVNQINWNDDLYTYTLISSIDMEEMIEMAKSILEK